MGRVMMAARMLFTCTVERRSGSRGAVHLPCGQQWWLAKCCMEKRGDSQNSVLMHYRDEW